MMMTPLQYMGEGEFKATIGHRAGLDKALVIGEVLHWEQINQRSPESHKHYFAVIADAWRNLPEAMATGLPSPKHLRKYALVKCGYCTIVNVACATNADAVRACAQFSAMDTYAVCSINDRLVTVATATSQSMRVMGNKTFQESKNKVLDLISQMIGADATQAGMAA